MSDRGRGFYRFLQNPHLEGAGVPTPALGVDTRSRVSDRVAVSLRRHGGTWRFPVAADSIDNLLTITGARHGRLRVSEVRT